MKDKCRNYIKSLVLFGLFTIALKLLFVVLSVTLLELLQHFHYVLLAFGGFLYQPTRLWLFPYLAYRFIPFASDEGLEL